MAAAIMPLTGAKPTTMEVNMATVPLFIIPVLIIQATLTFSLFSSKLILDLEQHQVITVILEPTKGAKWVWDNVIASPSLLVANLDFVLGTNQK